MKKIAFHSNQLSIRGTEVGLYNYAKYNEEMLGNKSVIFTFPNRDMGGYQKFADRFEVVILDWWDYEKYLLDNNFDYLFFIKMGIDDGYNLNSVKTLVQAVFRFNEPHGYKYFYVSDWLAKDQGYNPETHSLPRICEKLPNTNENFREELRIPTDSKVFGCYGGTTEFNIEFVKQTIRDLVRKEPNTFFIFMNINKFDDHPQVKFLPGNYDLTIKSKFVNTCDYMIHARSGGETFGQAVAEFALSNKPVITYGLSGEKSHIDILGDYGIYYNNQEEILNIFINTEKYIKYDNYSTPYLQFSPELIMKKFEKLL